MKFYAGIGSRKTPLDALEWMRRIGEVLDKHGWTLRSGGAQGADDAFEAGHTQHKKILLPWNGYNGRTGIVPALTPEALQLARQFHPAWHKLSVGAQKLIARNGFQVLGPDLASPSQYVICWTPRGSGEGGTGQALRIAAANQIPILDLGGIEPGSWPSVTRRFIARFDPAAAAAIGEAT